MNNRQNGRRRGRNNSNNNRSQSGGRGGVDQANRIDSRARGNAVQMIEKYKNLARDAQLAGDRVQTEYYLQFADHYFRVHSDFRARQEEKAAQSGQDRGGDRHREVRGVEDFDGHDDNDFESERSGGDQDRDAEPQRPARDERRDDRDDEDRGTRQQRGRRTRDAERAEAPRAEAAPADEADAAPAPRAAARRGPRRTRQQDETADQGGIDSAALPPAIGRAAEPDAEPKAEPKAEAAPDEAAPAPKPRRTRRTLAPRDTGVEAAE